MHSGVMATALKIVPSTRDTCMCYSLTSDPAILQPQMGQALHFLKFIFWWGLSLWLVQSSMHFAEMLKGEI